MAVVSRGGRIPAVEKRDARVLVQQLQKKQPGNPSFLKQALEVFDRYGAPKVATQKDGY